MPQIIAHLDDGRPTRCVGFWRHYSPEGYYTLTYGDCCQQIFEEITLRSIYDRATTNGYPLRDGEGKQCKERAEKWWKEFRKKGEKQILIEATMRGDRDSYLNAERLVKKFPEAAFEPLQLFHLLTKWQQGDTALDFRTTIHLEDPVGHYVTRPKVF